MRRLDAAVYLNHLEEARGSVAQARRAVVDVQHRRIEAALQLYLIGHRRLQSHCLSVRRRSARFGGALAAASEVDCARATDARLGAPIRAR